MHAKVSIIMVVTLAAQALLLALAWYVLSWGWFLLALLAVLVLGDVPLVLALQRYVPAHTGADAMCGQRAAVSAPFTPSGHGELRGAVRLGGERWRAWSTDPAVHRLAPGDVVRVRRVHGLVLEVAREDGQR